MSEQVATPETQQAERLGERRQALRGLAADMLLLWGTAEDRWRTVTWQDGTRSYCLNRGDFTQLQSEGDHSGDNWLYIIDGDEHDAFCLEPDHEFAAPDDVFVDLAEAVSRYASRTIYGRAQELLGAAPVLESYLQSELYEQPRQVRLQLDRHAARLQDFTTAQHEPFILVRTTSAYGAEHEVLSMYDITERELRHTDPHNPYGPVSAQAPQEEHLRWLMRMVTVGSTAPQPRGYHMFAAPRPAQPSGLVESAVSRIMAREQQTNEGTEQRQLTPGRAELAREAADILCGLEASHALYASTEPDGSTVIRTIVDLIEFDHSTQAGRTVETAVGFHITNDYIVLETISLDNEVDLGLRRIVYVDIIDSQASGMVSSVGSAGEPLPADTAVDELQEVVDSICTADIGRTLRPCTLDIAATFDTFEIRDSGR